MKNLIFLPPLFIFLSCSGSQYEYYRYEPEYEGKFVNSEQKLQAWYSLNKESYYKADSIHKAPFYGGYHLGKFNDKYKSDLDKFEILIFPDSNISLKKLRYRSIVDHESQFTSGLRIIILNNSKDTVTLHVQDGSVKMIQEALNPKEEWIPIEYWLNSTCGASYGEAHLHPNTYSETGAFRYTGTYKTKLRFKILYKTIYDAEKKKHIKHYLYSEPFEGRVNYSQLGEPQPIAFGEYLE